LGVVGAVSVFGFVVNVTFPFLIEALAIVVGTVCGPDGATAADRRSHGQEIRAARRVVLRAQASMPLRC
jgi:hypothetical protein